MGWLKKLLGYLFLFVVLAWDASPTPTVTGYKLYYEYRENVDGLGEVRTVEVIDVGNVLTYTIDVPAGRHWYFTVTAYDANGNESEPSNEVNTIPKKPDLQRR